MGWLYKLTISYHGAAYAGWQRQSNALAVQQVVEEALGHIVGAPPTVFGAGRTDSGVHALGQVAHLELMAELEPKALVLGTNRFLPADVRVLAAHRVAPGFHARHCALGKEYVYRVFRGAVPDALRAPLVTPLRQDLDLERLHRAAAVLRGQHDFSAFAVAGGSHHHGVRRLYAVLVEEHGREVWLRFVGDGFLRGMVRRLVGTLLEIARDQRSAEDLQALLQVAGTREAGPTAPAKGLTLERVFYASEWQPEEGYEA